MEKETFNELLKKYEEGQCTPEEAAHMESWFVVFAKEAPPLAGQPDYDRIDADLRQRLGLPSGEVRGTSKIYRVRMVLRYVAAILVFVAVGISIYQYTSDDKPSQQLSSKYGDDVLPGTNRATLALADGSIIELSESQDGIIINDDEVIYEDGASLAVISNEGQREEILQLVLTTPKGGQYQVTLPDGSKVWLNAASTLTYPSRFSDSARVVSLDGEAYFDISERLSVVDNRSLREKEKIPFLVKTINQTVEVLGTQFNISAYVDEEETKTTLVEGSVRVVPTTGRQSPVTIRPGDQSTVRGAQLDIQQVDANEYTAWKDGLFILNNADFIKAIRQLERWYDVEFVGDVASNAKVSAILPRTVNLSDVLNAMAENTNMKFTITGRRIMVQH